MAEKEANQLQDDPARRYLELQTERVLDLPAWAVEEVLRRGRRCRSTKMQVIECHFPPHTPFADLLKFFPWYLHVAVQHALKAVLADWDWKIANRDVEEDFPPPTYRRIPVGPDQKEYVLVEATILLSHPDGRKMLAIIGLGDGHGPGSDESVLILAMPDSEMEFGEKVLVQVEEWVDEHNYLRRRKLDFAGCFINEFLVIINIRRYNLYCKFFTCAIVSIYCVIKPVTHDFFSFIASEEYFLG